MALSKRLGAKLEVVSVDLSEDRDVVKSFVKKQHATFTVGLGTDSLARKYQIEAIPSNLVIDPDGKIVYGAEGFDEDEILSAVRKVEKSQAAAPTGGDAGSRSVTAETSQGESRGSGPPGGQPVTLSAKSFKDVPRDHWAAAAVELLRVRGLVIGYPPAGG